MVQPSYRLKLGQTYYNKGFFNLGVDIERYLFDDDCQITLFLGEQRIKIDARMTRKPNANGTPRVFGGVKLQKWFWANYDLSDVIDVVVVNPKEIWLRSGASSGKQKVPQNTTKVETTDAHVAIDAKTIAETVTRSDAEHINVGSYQFTIVCNIEPNLDDQGGVAQLFPQSRYDNTGSLDLNRYGVGPFCKFSIPRHYQRSGVYVLTSDQAIMYIGECQNLTERYNSGYGNISPKNCFVGGQETNCRINNLIYENVCNGHDVKLWFMPVSNFKDVEAELRAAIKTEWNRV